MKWVLNILGVFLVLTGIVWILQGFNLLLGSFMSGQPLYVGLGLIVAALGITILIFANRRRTTQR